MNGTEKPIDPRAFVKVQVAHGKAVKYAGQVYAAGDDCIMRKYEADAHSSADLVTIVALVGDYDPTAAPTGGDAND